MTVDDRIEEVVGRQVVSSRGLGGGQIGSVRLVAFDGGRTLVAKSSPGVDLNVEARMLRYLAEETSLPVPAVVHADRELLLMERVPGSTGADGAAARHAAHVLADLHDITSDAFGFGWDTLLGPFTQPNERSTDWAGFFGERRLRHVAWLATERGELPSNDRDGVERLIGRLPQLLDHDPAPSLIHGDVWTGNVLSEDESVTGFLDPAIWFADAEVEIACIELFGTFGRAFFDAYVETRRIDEGYAELRRDIYQVYPLLVHVAIFGRGYLSGLRERLRRIEART